MPVLSIANIYAMSAPPGTIPYVPTAAELAIPTQTVTIIQNAVTVQGLTRQQPAITLPPRICPAYHTAIETLKPKIAAQLAHYTHNTHPDATLTPNNISGTEIFRTAAIASKTTEEFLLSLFNSCKTSTEPSQQDNDNAQQEQTHDSQIDIDNTSITAIQTHTQDTQTQMPQGLTQTHTQLQTQKTQGQTHTTHKTSITAIQTHTQDSQTQKPQELPQPHTQNTQETQHIFHSKKQPVHKFCVDTSKHLMRKPSLLIGKTPIPNTVIQFSEYVYPDCQKPHHTPCHH